MSRYTIEIKEEPPETGSCGCMGIVAVAVGLLLAALITNNKSAEVTTQIAAPAPETNQIAAPTSDATQKSTPAPVVTQMAAPVPVEIEADIAGKKDELRRLTNPNDVKGPQKLQVQTTNAAWVSKLTPAEARELLKDKAIVRSLLRKGILTATEAIANK